MNWLLKLISRVVVIILLSYFMTSIEISGDTKVDVFVNTLVFAVVLGFLNTFLKPILSLFSLPITFFTLGLFQLVVNTFVVILAIKLSDGFNIEGFFNQLVFTIVYSIISSAIENIFSDKK